MNQNEQPHEQWPVEACIVHHDPTEVKERRSHGARKRPPGLGERCPRRVLVHEEHDASHTRRKDRHEHGVILDPLHT